MRFTRTNIKKSDNDYPNLSGFTVLIVDDDYDNCNLLKFILKKSYINVKIAKDGYKAIEMCKKINIDLIFLDIRMPGMNGYEVYDIIKKDKPKMNIVMHTAFIDEKIAGYEYLYKPFDIKKAINFAIKYLK